MSNDRLAIVLDAGEEPAVARPGRCATHPAAPEVGQCSVCGRALCLTCATPVRGDLVGPECLSAVLDEIPPPTPVPVHVPASANWLVMGGFGLVALLSIFPWSRYGDSSGFLEAWTVHWSLLAVTAGVAGFAGALWLTRRPADPRIETALYAGLALVVATAAILHLRRPPPLSASAVAPVLAIGAALIALAGAMMRFRALRMAIRP
ncbi:MAG TPA: hypothetical protein VHI54_01580 [Actinomycetota bacterium]|nr:hypothetical protein [Actinomycetota bacterium]